MTEDQRGLSRPVDTAGVTNAASGDGSDIGAYESGNGPTISVSGTPCFAAASRMSRDCWRTLSFSPT